MSEPTFREKYAWYCSDYDMQGPRPSIEEVERAWAEQHADPVESIAAELAETWCKDDGPSESTFRARKADVTNLLRSKLGPHLVSKRLREAAVAWWDAIPDGHSTTDPEHHFYLAMVEAGWLTVPEEGDA